MAFRNHRSPFPENILNSFLVPERSNSVNLRVKISSQNYIVISHTLAVKSRFGLCGVALIPHFFFPLLRDLYMQ